MKAKFFLTAVLFSLAMSVSAQIQLLYIENTGRNVIDRSKKLYWMDGDSDPCYKILNYKKTGNKETFRLESKKLGGYNKPDVWEAVITLDAKTQLPVEISLNNKSYGAKLAGKVETSSGDSEEDARLQKYFRELAGYHAEASTEGNVSTTSVPKSTSDLKAEAGSKSTTDKVKDAAKNTMGKVKGLFKKKK